MNELHVIGLVVILLIGMFLFNRLIDRNDYDNVHDELTLKEMEKKK